MRPTPTHALITLLATATGALTGWYCPGPVLPAAVFAVLAYTAAIVGLAALLRIDRDEALTSTTLLAVRTLVITIQTAAGAALHLLTAAETWLVQHQPATKTTTYIHAA